MRQGGRVEWSGAAPPTSGLARPGGRSRVNSTESSAAGAEERRRHVLALVADASADADLQGLTAALQRVCRAATAALGLRGAAVHVMAESGAARRGGLLGRRGPRRRRAAVHRQRRPRLGGVPHPAPRARAPARRGPRPLARLLLARDGARRPRRVLLSPSAGRRLPRGPRPVRRPGRTARRRRARVRRRLRPGGHRPPARRRHGRHGPGSWTRDCPPLSRTGRRSTRRRGW